MFNLLISLSYGSERALVIYSTIVTAYTSFRPDQNAITLRYVIPQYIDDVAIDFVFESISKSLD
ncbi:hypothetical protein HLBS07_30350 [Vibrio alginolyticus]|nr:hypothetical protein HLBS07_30350 [Vibrio alginolyticus]